MIWLEMSRDEQHGGGTWGFQKCIWSPSRKKDGNRWTFWETVKNVTAGDIVIHLRGKNNAAFVGYSIATTDGFETADHPPAPGEWKDATTFYKANLEEFIPFLPPVRLHNVFAEKDASLRKYFLNNKNKPIGQRERLFYVIQAGRLQCLNGAYLSEISWDLLHILLDMSQHYSLLPQSTKTIKEVNTNESFLTLKTRIGQEAFSDAVCSNYNHQCCFPGCKVAERGFLIGAHIARWSDNPKLRGNIANGLCFCLMHDKAFEKGLFTIDLDFRIWSEETRIAASHWGTANIVPFIGKKIKPGNILPLEEALLEHWERVSLYPQSK